MSKVALVRCESYDYSVVKTSVIKGINLLGGPGAFAKPGEKILLKPNWLVADPPEKGSTTHPMVLKAVSEVLMTTGAKLFYGDSPGFQSPESAAKKTGSMAVAAELNMTLADFVNGKEIFFNEAVQNKKFVIANGVLESDGLISLPKLKTHGFARMTGCVKNQFGCIPGARKGEFHVKIPDVFDFSRMLVDLNMYIKPRLYVMDGVIAMEGNGPRGGNLKKMNILLFSADPIALDATVCRLIGLDPEFVPTVKIGKEAGHGTYLQDEIELLGDPIASFIDLNFDVTRKPLNPIRLFSGLPFLKNSLVSKPVITESKCVKCGICVKMCPVTPKAVDWHDGQKEKTPSYKYKRCIRCYCCQELCPESAINLKAPLIRRFLGKLLNRKKVQ